MQVYPKFIFSLFFCSVLLYSGNNAFAQAPAENPAQNLVKETFYIPSEVKKGQIVYDVEGFALVPQDVPAWKSKFAVVTGFKGNVLTTHVLKNVQTVDKARELLLKKVKAHDLESGVTVREYALKKEQGDPLVLYWVGNRAFRSLEDAEQSVNYVKQTVEQDGGDFAQAVLDAQKESKETPRPKPAPLTNGESEEAFAMKMIDWLGWDVSPFGPLAGTASGERIIYQSIFQGDYRVTNFTEKHFDAYTGFWAHRLVFKGIDFIGDTTVDPFVEAVPTGQTEGRDFATHVNFLAGLEWRPFARTAVLQNYQPWGLPILDWLRNTRAYTYYGERKNLKDKFSDVTRTYELRAGVEIFKEWGMDLPDMTRFQRESPFYKPSDLYWGELFTGTYFAKTDFGIQDNWDAIQYFFAFKIGIKWPRFPLPDNPINREAMFMPYFTFEDVRNFEHSFFFQNRLVYGVGVRWMPFRDYRFMNGEWLFKTKFFFEYLPDIYYSKSQPGDPKPPQKDLRIGVNMSVNRF